MNKTKTTNLTMTALMTALICILAPLSIPFPGGVPLSLTNLVIGLAVYLLGLKRGTICCSLYLLIGLVGLPVFSGFTGGVGKLGGPTGGYLTGFVIMSVVCGVFLNIGKGKRVFYATGMALGILADYICGSLWFMYSMKMSLRKTLVICVLPFVGFDLIKIVITVILGPAIKKRIFQE